MPKIITKSRRNSYPNSYQNRYNITTSPNLFLATCRNFIRAHPFFTAFAIFFIVVVVILLIFIASLQKTATLDLLVSPTSATVTIGGKTYKNGTYTLSPGTYHVKIEKTDFDTKELDIELVANETYQLYTYLLQTDGSYSWYLSHNEDAMLLNTIGDAEAADTSQTYFDKYPIAEILPIVYANYDENYNYTEYRIDGGFFDNCPTDFCLQISDTTGGNYDAALQQIRDKSYDPDDYTILYKETPIEPLE